MKALRDKIDFLKYSFISGNMSDEYMFWSQLENILNEMLDRLEKLEALDRLEKLEAKDDRNIQ
jgi:hypothetical protein